MKVNDFPQNQRSYEKVLSVLIDLHAMGDGSPPIVMCDFERGLINAVREKLPWTVVSPFFFCKKCCVSDSLKGLVPFFFQSLKEVSHEF